MKPATDATPLPRIERREGLFVLTVAAPELHVYVPDDRKPVTAALARDVLRRECRPYALCGGPPELTLRALDAARRLDRPPHAALADRGATATVVGRRVVIGDGDAHIEHGAVAIQGAPLLVEDRETVVDKTRTVVAWRAALAVPAPEAVAFVVGYDTLRDFADRLQQLGAIWAVHGAAGDSVRLMDGRGDWRGSPRNKPGACVWYAAAPLPVAVIGVRDARGARVG